MAVGKAYSCAGCGASLPIEKTRRVYTCELCGVKQIVPGAESEEKYDKLSRARKHLHKCNFDRAAEIFEEAVKEYPDEPEAYWGLCLCKYGIEYVKDPVTGDMVLTCRRTSFDSILDDENYISALDCAPPENLGVYRVAADKIDERQQRILDVVRNEPPVDVFICYKENEDDRTAKTEHDRERTRDSVIAQDIYNALIKEGKRVFFSRVTLRGKPGAEYEPYIFAALETARVMLLVSTSGAHIEATWVQNEWRRFYALRKKDKNRELILCYDGKTILLNELPAELKPLQATDISKVGFMQDLIPAVLKMLENIEPIPLDKLPGRSEVNIDTSFVRGAQALNMIADMRARIQDGSIDNTLRAKCYELACSERDRRNDATALELFKLLNNYSDAPARAQECARYLRARAPKLLDIMAFAKKRNMLAVGLHHCVGLKSDGTVLGVGDNSHRQIDVSAWRDIQSVSAGDYHTVGLKYDGTVVGCGNNDNNQLDDFGDFPYARVTAMGDETYAVTCATDAQYNGRVFYTKHKGYFITISGKKVESYDKGVERAIEARIYDIAALNSNEHLIIELFTDKSVYAFYKDEKYRAIANEVCAWQDIEMIATGRGHVVGLTIDGTVVAQGDNDYGQCDVNDWRDIIYVAACGDFTAGLKMDGTVVYAGKPVWVKYAADVTAWKLFDTAYMLEEELAAEYKKGAKLIKENNETREKRITVEKKKRSKQSLAENKKKKRIEKRKSRINALKKRSVSIYMSCMIVLSVAACAFMYAYTPLRELAVSMLYKGFWETMLYLLIYIGFAAVLFIPPLILYKAKAFDKSYYEAGPMAAYVCCVIILGILYGASAHIWFWKEYGGSFGRVLAIIASGLFCGCSGLFGGIINEYR